MITRRGKGRRRHPAPFAGADRVSYSRGMAPGDEPEPLSDAERARMDRRDRRRRPRMVMDNAGVKRVLQALARRRHRKETQSRRHGPGA